jgi:hypothetical protein
MMKNKKLTSKEGKRALVPRDRSYGVLSSKKKKKKKTLLIPLGTCEPGLGFAKI